MAPRILTHFFLAALIALVSACGKKGCDGPAINLAKLNALKEVGLQNSGPRAFLVLPNPIDATQIPTASISDSNTLKAGNIFNLDELLDGMHLENSFLKVRIRAITDSLSTLATPNSKGDFSFPPSDIRYSETMAYRSISAIQDYVEGLGFSVVKTRPLYVMVQTEGSTNKDVNAYYDHAYLNPGTPRTIKLFGASQFAPGVDQDMYWHEFGHLFNESVTKERGMDYAGDNGAVWSEGSALHECLADYLSESVSDKPYIGKWIARNLSGFKPGDPLRSATNTGDRKSDFKKVSRADGTGATPERYEVAEWCTRVLWDIRKSFVDDNGEAGPILSDRMIYSAASLLQKDTSISQFQAALMQADEQLHCGGHRDAIKDAFEGRGFFKADALDKPLQIQAQPVTVKVSDSGITPVSAGPGVTVLFNVRIVNPSGKIARNVRLRLEPRDSRLVALTYQQSYGDMSAGQTLNIGLSSSGLGGDYSVVGQIPNSATSGSVAWVLRLMSENGKDVLYQGELRF